MMTELRRRGRYRMRDSERDRSTNMCNACMYMHSA